MGDVRDGFTGTRFSAGGAAPRSNGGHRPLWLNLGCGHNTTENWLNFDRSPMIALRHHRWLKRLLRSAGILHDEHMADYPANVTRRNLVRPLPFEDATVSAIYSSHLLEHMYIDDARRLLRECHRVCQKGAVLRFALPDALEFASQLVAAGDDEGGKAAVQFNDMLRAYPTSRPTGPRRVAFLGGSNWHKWQPTAGLVRSMLDEAGFVDVTQHEYRVGTLPELDVVEVRIDSMFFEARR